MQNNNLTSTSTITLNIDNKIPMLGYGTYQLKGQDCLIGLTQALKCGYTHIDTASVYKNQLQICKVLQTSLIPRQQLYITSKIGPAQQGKQQSRLAVQNILKNLNCKYLDLILIHWPGAAGYKPQQQKNKQIRLQTWNTFIELQKQGKVKDIGVSNFMKHHLQHLSHNSQVIPAVNQFQLHPLLWQQQTIKYCKQHNIVIQAYSPLARHDDRLFKNKVMLELSQKYKKTIAQISLRWCLQHGFVVIPKSKNIGRIKQNIGLYDFVIDQNDMKKIDQLRAEKVRTCWDPNSVKY